MNRFYSNKAGFLKVILLLFAIPILMATDTKEGQEFVDISTLDSSFSYDMKYATTDNFLHEKVYECDACVIRAEVAYALIEANNDFKKQGYQIEFFDCYRPLDIQRKMWDILPNGNYVANPNTRGSSHNRGGAIDITICKISGESLEMGTKFDHFGKEAHHDYVDLPENVLANRQILKSTMEKYGFKSLRTEWWHYNHKNASSYTLSNFTTQCE